MPKSIIHIYVNSSGISRTDLNTIMDLNGTIIGVAQKPVYRDSQINELLYVVIVIMFYAMALMVLIATQIRKQSRGQEIDYYDEYLERNDRMTKKKKMLATITTVEHKTSPGAAITTVPEEEHLTGVTVT